jgi:hypothetical protein
MLLPRDQPFAQGMSPGVSCIYTELDVDLDELTRFGVYARTSA